MGEFAGGAMDDSANMEHTELKKWLLGKGCTKQEVDHCPGKPSLLSMWRQKQQQPPLCSASSGAILTVPHSESLRGLPVHLVAMVVERLPVHPRPLATAANTSTWTRAAVDELVLAIQQALCAEYGVDRIQDIPAGVLPKLSEEGETEQVLRFIVARCPLDGVAEDGWTGLAKASYHGFTGIVNALILAGAVLDIQNKYGWTGLMQASNQGHIDIVNALILAGAVLDIQDDYGETALTHASDYGLTEIEDALRAAGATQ